MVGKFTEISNLNSVFDCITILYYNYTYPSFSKPLNEVMWQAFRVDSSHAASALSKTLQQSMICFKILSYHFKDLLFFYGHSPFLPEVPFVFSCFFSIRNGYYTFTENNINLEYIFGTISKTR